MPFGSFYIISFKLVSRNLIGHIIFDTAIITPVRCHRYVKKEPENSNSQSSPFISSSKTMSSTFGKMVCGHAHFSHILIKLIIAITSCESEFHALKRKLIKYKYILDRNQNIPSKLMLNIYRYITYTTITNIVFVAAILK